MSEIATHNNYRGTRVGNQRSSFRPGTNPHRWEHRRWIELFETFRCELGREPNETERLTLRRAASLALEMELAEKDLVDGDGGRLSGMYLNHYHALVAILRSLGIALSSEADALDDILQELQR